jgi:uncharacterized Zn finger protein
VADELAAVARLLGDAALCSISSAKIVERGITYARSGAVTILEEQSAPVPMLRAEVAGTETYATSVAIEGTAIVGACNCMNAASGWFCKHQVAVALVWRQRLTGEQPVIDEAARSKVQASAKRAQTVRDRRKALSEFLHSQSTATLADKLISIADHDRDIERQLQLWRKTTQVLERPEDIKSLITETLSVGQGFIPLPEVFAWVRRAEAVLTVLQQARQRDAHSALGLCLHALRRGWAAMQRADDSNGEMGNLCQLIASEWLAALQTAGAQPATFGETYLRMQLEDPFDSFDQQVAETAMGTAALNRYRKTLASQWRETKDIVLARKAERVAKVGKRPRILGEWASSDEVDSQLRTLERLHLEQLHYIGDVDGALAVLREDMSEPQHYWAVTNFLETHQRHREALKNAEAGYKVFPDDWRLQEQLLAIYERDGWVNEVYALRRKQFDANPDVQKYHRVLKAGNALGMAPAVLREELWQRLVEQEEKAMQTSGRRAYSTQRNANVQPPRNVSLRTQILCSEQRWQEALDLVQPPAVCDMRVLRQLALSLAEEQREQAVTLLLRIFTKAMQTAQTPYREELAMVGEISERLDAKNRADWLANLRTEFKAKRNFVRDLPSG